MPLDVARAWPQLEDWGLTWVGRIRELYQFNDKRVEVIDQPKEFAQADQRVREQVTTIQKQAQSELAEPNLHPAKKHLLESTGGGEPPPRLEELPILGDALEEAGCRDEAMLTHCHGPAEHVRGCWVLDLLLIGRE